MKNKVFIFITFLICAVAFAAGVKEDVFKIGKVGSSSDKVLELGETRKIRSNEASGVLEFTNDGSIYKRLGSGSGSGSSGVNSLAELNSDFEDGLTAWTTNGGAFTLESASPLFGLNSGQFLTTLSAQKIISGTGPLENGFEGQSCQLEFTYLYEEASIGYLYRVLDGPGGNVLVERDIPFTNGEPKKIFDMFSCPDPATENLVVEIESKVNAAGVIVLDSVFLGSGRNTLNISQAEIVATAKWVGATSICRFDGSTDTVTYGPMAPDADCPDPTVTGLFEVANSKVPGINAPYLPPGRYELSVEALFDSQGGSDTECLYTITDGLTQDGAGLSFEELGADDVVVRTGSMTGYFTYPNGRTNGFFEVYNLRTAGSGECNILQKENAVLKMVLKKFPLVNAEAITLETSKQVWEASVVRNPGAPIGLGFTNVTAAQIGGSDFELVPLKGEGLKIACTGANAPTGTTCSTSAEVLGFAFTPDQTATHEVCASMHIKTVGGPADGVYNTFNLDLVDASNTLIKRSRRIGTQGGYDSASGSSDYYGDVDFCDQYDLIAGQEAIFKVTTTRFEVNNPVVINEIVNVPNLSDAGNYNAYFRARNIDVQFPTPVFTDLTNALNAKAESTAGGAAVEFAVINQTGTQSFDEKGGDWIQSITDGGAGYTTLNFIPGTFALEPVCVATSRSSASGSVGLCRVFNSTATQVDVQCEYSNGGADSDNFFSFVCIGRK